MEKRSNYVPSYFAGGTVLPFSAGEFQLKSVCSHFRADRVVRTLAATPMRRAFAWKPQARPTRDLENCQHRLAERHRGELFTVADRESVWEDYERLDAQSGPSLQRPFRSRARSCHAEHRAAERAIARNTASLICSPCVGKRKTPGGSDLDRLWSRTIRSMAKCSLGRLEKKAPLGRSLSMLFDSIQAFSAIPVRPSPQAPIVEPMRRTRPVLQCL